MDDRLKEQLFETRKSKRGGAPPGNGNAIKSGLRTRKNLPGAAYLVKQVTIFRRAAEAAIIEKHGQIAFSHGVLLQTACEHFAHGLRVRRWLRLGWDGFNTDQRLAYSREIGLALDRRDKVLKQLDLDQNPNDPASTLYTFFELPDDESECPPTAPGEHTPPGS